MFIVFIRTVILYTLVVVVVRIMGKRQIGELQPYEFVITIMISDLASLPMQDTRYPLLLGVIPIITLLFLKTILSQLELKSQLVRKLIDGEPCILIYKSKINYDMLKKQQINIDELMEEIRLAGYFDLEEIQYAILENNGQLSILPADSNSFRLGQSDTKKSQTNNDNSNSSNKPPHLPKILITDGKVNTNSLTSIGKDRNWILKELKNHNINSIEDVLIAMYDTQGKFKYQLFDDYEKECKK
ncbi:MAG: DUF421 domain-containing protein [Clostridium sp.]|uniref:DUF421 domain-containing protein n=1 Tax=Clostridium sp. DSM 8431 TaxID=1761781 RepID=UPI0008E5B0BF|nr:DUF421 domain-containing protein [Clostridium sp. DSM 8431]MCR4944467.1 DUF421 domain-containing protein [Clostridium sp.]SFU74922.1 Uncharacterized membrane protein YcaP, DUF421 family [Clostridium sp. DSM 8431]